MSGSSVINPAYVSVGAAQSFVEGEFGGPVTESNKAVSLLAATATRLLLANPERLSLTIINLGAHDAYIDFDPDVSDTHGIAIGASGGYMSANVRDDQMLQTREWYAYAPAGATDLYVITTERYGLTL